MNTLGYGRPGTETGPQVVSNMSLPPRYRSQITYPATIKSIGNTYHIIVPKDYVNKCGWGDGTDVDVTIRQANTINSNDITEE